MNAAPFTTPHYAPNTNDLTHVLLDGLRLFLNFEISVAAESPVSSV